MAAAGRAARQRRVDRPAQAHHLEPRPQPQLHRRRDRRPLPAGRNRRCHRRPEHLPAPRRRSSGCCRSSGRSRTSTSWSAASAEQVSFEDMAALAALPQVAMVEWQAPVGLGNDVGSRANQSRPARPFRPTPRRTRASPAPGVTIAVLDTGVDDAHQSFAGKFVAGFDATIFEDTNGNQIDDSCEPAPLGNGVCTDAGDEPGNGTTQPARQPQPRHPRRRASHSAPPSPGSTCTTSRRRIAGELRRHRARGPAWWTSASATRRLLQRGHDGGARLAAASTRQAFNVRVATMSVGGISGINDDGTSARAQQLNYLVSPRRRHGGRCTTTPPTAASRRGRSSSTCRSRPPSPSPSAGTNDRNTVARTDDTNYSGFLRGPRTDFNADDANLLGAEA